MSAPSFSFSAPRPSRSPWWPALAVFLLLTPTPSLLAEDPAPDFSGTWQLNEGLSTSPRGAQQQGRGRRGRSGFSVGANSRGLGGGYGNGSAGGRPPRAREEQGGERLQEQMRALRTLTLVHLDPELRMQDADGQETVLYTDEQVFERQGPRGRSQEMRGQWQRQALRFETVQANYGPGNEEDPEEELEQQANPFRRGPRESRQAVETWRLSPDGQQLTISLEIQGDGQRSGHTFKRVYDRLEVALEVPAEPSTMKGTLVPLDSEGAASAGSQGPI